MHSSGQTGIVATRQNSAAVLTLARKDHANSYTQAMLESLDGAIDAADQDPQIRTIVVTGEGERVFCAGADRTEIATRDWRSVLSLTSARVFRRLRESRCVTIAAINGSAVGGGLELALSCDFRFAVPEAKFWLPEPELGLIPAAGGTELLPRLVGPAKAKEMILGGAVWDAPQALQYGLITEMVDRKEIWPRMMTWIDRIGARDAEALRFAKRAIDLSVERGSGAGSELTAQALLVLRQRQGRATS